MSWPGNNPGDFKAILSASLVPFEGESIISLRPICRGKQWTLSINVGVGS